MLPPQPDDRAADLVVLHGGHELLVVGEGTAGDDVGVHVGAAELKMYHVTMYSNELYCRIGKSRKNGFLHFARNQERGHRNAIKNKFGIFT